MKNTKMMRQNINRIIFLFILINILTLNCRRNISNQIQKYFPNDEKIIAIWYFNIDKDKEKELLVASEKKHKKDLEYPTAFLYIFDVLSKNKYKKILKENMAWEKIEQVRVDDINKDGTKEIIIISPAGKGVSMEIYSWQDNTLKCILDEWVTEGFKFKDIDGDGIKEIIFDSRTYEIKENKEGNYLWEYETRILKWESEKYKEWKTKKRWIKQG